MSKGNSLLDGSTADYSAVCKEIADGANNPAPRKQAETLAKLISSDKAYNKDGGPINASRFIRAVMAEYIPGVDKLTAKNDVVAYTYYANIRRLTKKALGFKANKAPVQKTGIDRVLATVAKLATVADVKRVIRALQARKKELGKVASKAA